MNELTHQNTNQINQPLLEQETVWEEGELKSTESFIQAYKESFGIELNLEDARIASIDWLEFFEVVVRN